MLTHQGPRSVYGRPSEAVNMNQSRKPSGDAQQRVSLHPLTPEQAIAKAFGAPPPKGTPKPKASKQARKK